MARHTAVALSTLGWANCILLVLCVAVVWTISRLDVNATAVAGIQAAATAHQAESAHRWSRQLVFDVFRAWFFGATGATPVSWQAELMPLWASLGNR